MRDLTVLLPSPYPPKHSGRTSGMPARAVHMGPPPPGTPQYFASKLSAFRWYSEGTLSARTSAPLGRSRISNLRFGSGNYRL